MHISKRYYSVVLFLALSVIFHQPLSAQYTYMYGMTQSGGSYGKGAIIKFNPTTNKDSLEWSFGNGTDGASPTGDLTFDEDNGMLYGMTYSGGSTGYGAIIRFNTKTKTDSVVWNFGNPGDGQNPEGSLIYDRDNGLFYGMTSNGGLGYGEIISFNPVTNKDSAVWIFGNGTDAKAPYGNLFYYPGNGMLYGMTAYGGTLGKGAIFRFNPVTNKDTVLWNLGSGTDGVSPYGSLIYLKDSNQFYGLTSLGGIHTAGAIISFNPVTNRDSLLWSFYSPTDGSAPYGDLVYDKTRNVFYAMPLAGGAYLYGTIIKFDPVKDTDYLLSSFGARPDAEKGYGNLVYDWMNGYYYGMTLQGGSVGLGSGDGTIIRLNPTSGSKSVVWNFGSGSDGIYPHGSLIFFNPSILPMRDSISSSSNVSCYGDSNGSATIGVINGTTPYTYSWSTLPVQTNATASGLSAGSYTVTIVDSNGFERKAYVTITQPPVITDTQSIQTCSGNKITIGIHTYDSAGTYVDTLTALNGCDSIVTTKLTYYPYNGFDLTGALYICIDTPSASNVSVEACIYNSRCLSVNGTLKLLLDTALHINNLVADTAAIISGDTLIWHYDSLSEVGKTHCVTLTGSIDSLFPSGDSVFASLFVTPVAGDSVPANNAITYWVKPSNPLCVGYPYDPNEKSVFPEGTISVSQQLHYTIHFQNTGTGIAKNVIVVDTLSPYLDPTTLKVISSSSIENTTITGNIVTFELDNINLPDTAMSKTYSIGIIQYTIKPMSNDSPGDVIPNTAGIYFDANPVIITNTTIDSIPHNIPLSLDNIPALLNIACFPNPFTTTTNVIFNTLGKHYLEIDDVTGRRLKIINCTGKQYKLNSEGLDKGIYFLKAFDKNQRYISTIKLILQ